MSYFNLNEYSLSILYYTIHLSRVSKKPLTVPNSWFPPKSVIQNETAPGDPEAVSFLRNDERIVSRFYLFYKRKIRGISFLPSGAAACAIRLKFLGTTPGSPKPLHGPAICYI